MVYSILSEARVRHSVAPLKSDSTQYQVVWDENRDLKGWNTFFELDVIGAWGGFLFGTKRSESGGYIGPSSDFAAVDALVNDRVFFRMKYDQSPLSTAPTSFGKIAWVTSSDPIFNETKSLTFDINADGKWHLYEINMGESFDWIGEITRVRFHPCEDGAFNDEFFLGFFEIGTNAFEFSFDSEDAGSAGFVQGGSPILGSVLIEKDVNDKLIVNLDGYGDVQITLTPQESTAFLIARDISLQLGKVAIGGYPRAEAFLTDSQLLRIESGTRASDSSATIEYGSNSAAFVLGLTTAAGLFVGTTGTGTDPSSSYVPLSAYRPLTLEILALFDNDDSLPAFSLAPQQYIVQGGNVHFDVVNQKITQEPVFEGRNTGLQGAKFEQDGFFPGVGLTFIDLNHPFSDEGQVDRIFMNGSPDTGGSSKWKIFRPSLDGKLTLVSEGVIGLKDFTDDPNGGLVGSPAPSVFVADVTTSEIFVRRGDLLGIYNTDLHAGAGTTLKPDALYYQVSGDAVGTFTPPSPEGAGETGISVYAHGLQTKNRAVIDIDLQRRLNIDKLFITGEEDQTNLEYNLGIATSAVYQSDVSGSHTICYNPAPDTRVCVERQNESFNIQALNDGVRLAENGVSAFGDPGPTGAGGATSAGATYFYTNGDGEFFETFEFVNQSPDSYDFERDAVGIDCFFSSQTPRPSKSVGKIVMYFKDKKNQRAWQLDYAPSDGGKGGDGSKSGFSVIPEDSIQHVKIDQQKIINYPPGSTLKDIGMDLLLSNPSRLDVIAADGTINPVQGVDYVKSVAELGGINFREQSAFSNMQWNRFEWVFDPVRTTAIRWQSDLHWSTKISEMEIYGVSQSDESLADNVQIFFSEDGQLFSSGELLNANEKEAEFKVGNSPQFIRLIIRPTLQTSISDVKVRFEEDQVCFGEEGRIENSIHLTDARVGSVGASVPLKVINTLGQKADLIVDVPEDIESARQLLYFNQLNSLADIQSPQIGPPARIDFTEDKVLKEESSVTLSAQAYGLISLVSGTESFKTGNLATNGAFETGDLTGWDLVVVNSGSLPFQIPRVADFSEYSSGAIQGGSRSFGFNIDLEDPSHEGQFTQVTFDLSQTTDLTEYAASLDQGAATLEWSFRYADYGTGGAPRFRLLGSPTLSGVLEDPGHVVGDYGSNQLSIFAGRESTGLADASTGNITFNGQTLLKSGTRFVRMLIEVDKTGADTSATLGREIWHMDAYGAVLNAPAVTIANWYKSYLTGVKDFTDAQYVPVDTGLLTTVTGSSHWYQPARQLDIDTPDGSQSLGFTNAFNQDRNSGVQSFSRMTATNPGILGMQWGGEKVIGGIRIAHTDFRDSTLDCTSADHYPRYWDIEALKTQAELGGIPPDVNENSHWKTVRQVRALLRDDEPQQLQLATSTFGGTKSKINTFIFLTPVTTEGIRIVYLRNCDTFERSLFPLGPSGYPAFSAALDCPDNSTIDTDFKSNTGIRASMFMALESVGRNTLPVDNTVDREYTPGVAECGGVGGVIHVAVDLGRHFNIDTASRVFELISETLNQTPWPNTALFSGDDVSDPNLVDWAGSSSFARWIRFESSAAAEFELNVQGSTGGSTTEGKSPYQIDNFPQAILYQARIYPRITQAAIPHQGPNHFWDPLGDVLTDNRNTTSINYSDYPVICFDLNRPYRLSTFSAATELRRDLLTPGAKPATDDKGYWDVDDDSNFTYSNKSFIGVGSPENVEYSDWGTATPSTAIRWVAVRGDSNLLQSDLASQPKQYNFNTQGGTLFGVNFAPAQPEIFTENSNWFSTTRAGLQDVSTFNNTQGNLYSLLEGVDYGASHNSSDVNTIGDPFFLWDGKFDEISEDDYWGVFTKNTLTDLVVPGSEFPHYVWRVFHDAYRGDVITKEIKAITVLGYDTEFYPTDFKIQTLTNSESDPTLDASWLDIDQASFTGVDSYNEGIGFTHIFINTIETSGMRVYVEDSVYPDESVLNEPNEVGQSNQFGIGRGPQTRVVSIQLFEETVSSANIQGLIETNHAWGSTASSLTFVPEHQASYMVDGDNGTFWQATGFTDTLTVTLAEPKTVNRFEWEMDESYAKQVGTGLRTNAPATFTLKANPGSVEQVVLTEEDFVGLTFSGTLNPPITADTWTLEVDSVQGQGEDANSIVIHEFRLLESEIQLTPLVEMADVPEVHPNSTNQRGTKITYAVDSVAVAAVSLDGIDANNDADFSERDFFVFWMKINDIALLDTNFGTIRLGNDRDISYVWNMKELSLQSGWNEIKLQFKSAADRSEIPFQPGASYDLNTGESQVDFVTADFVITSSVDGNYTRNVFDAPGIRYFELEFRGVGSSRNLELILDDMQFVRNNFDDVCNFTPSLYLNNSETFTIYQEGLDISIGTVEFWFQPDWGETGRVNQFTDVLPSIFKITRPDGKFMTFFFRPGIGFIVIINDLERLYQFQSKIENYTFAKYQTMHVALVWDVNGSIGPLNSTVQIVVDGEIVYGSNRSWEGVREGGASVMFGGEVGQAIAAAPQNETATTFTPVPTQPATNTASTWALLENIKIYNYAKTDFSDRFDRDLLRSQLLKPSDMIEISLDNVNFHSSGSDDLPLVSLGVEDGEEATIYIRSNIPKDITGNENRDASLLVRWKTPLVNCD